MSQQDSGPHTDDELDYLLSEGRLGGGQRDRIFDAVARSFAGKAPATPARAGSWMGWLALPLAAAAAFAIWLRTSADGGHFQSKGDGRTSPAALEVACLRATLTACPPGALLAFSARGVPAGALLTSVLEPAGGDARVWLLSNEPLSAQAPPPAPPGLLARAARLPEDQKPGAYHIRMIVTQQPLSRELVVDAGPEQLVARASFDLTVVP